MKQLNIRLNSWRSVWLGVGALLASAVFLWIGFALAMVIAVLAGAALLASWMRRLWTCKSAAREAVTIEGHCTKIQP